MLKLESVNVAYGDVQVLWDVSMEIKQGEIVALVGANAAGKTSTINTISGISKPLSGSITFEGKPLHEMPAYEIVKLGIVQVPEGRRLFSHMTVLENLELGAYTSQARKARKESLELVFELLPDLKAKKNDMAASLSGGQQQMCAIGRGLMAKPRILMMDELSLGLAPMLVKQTFEIVKQINQQGTTILLVEQNIHQSLRISQSAYVLENGRIALSGKADELITDERLKTAYLGM
ncbi:ABC transporter ATP-binding protein [Metallumcola ferriviriculae]|uniref:ABC transporter ATP-binding protein n=1 Tax=Metallumcola ferriviriculae TaxID=3039180 RepID=A0AAU0URG0_9FIRM|nr:ABC transporter ATP-binding protein [Desulfitibacteraceae bacterium MK1]